MKLIADAICCKLAASRVSTLMKSKRRSESCATANATFTALLPVCFFFRHLQFYSWKVGIIFFFFLQLLVRGRKTASAVHSMDGTRKEGAVLTEHSSGWKRVTDCSSALLVFVRSRQNTSNICREMRLE